MLITQELKKVICNKDKERMQEDLEIIHKWADENKMKFNTNKFEQIAHRKRKSIEVEPYKTPSGDPFMTDYDKRNSIGSGSILDK